MQASAIKRDVGKHVHQTFFFQRVSIVVRLYSKMSTVSKYVGIIISAADCYLALMPVAAQYHSLGQQLGLEEHQLDEIEADHPLGSDGAVQRRLNSVLRVWYRGQSNATWSDVITALRIIGETRLAAEIEIQHCKGLTHALHTPSTNDLKADTVSLRLAHKNRIMMMDRFAKLKIMVSTRIQQRIDSNEVHLEEVLIYAMEFFPEIHCVSRTSRVGDLFVFITHKGLWSYMDPEPLNHIANAYGGTDPELKIEVQRYTQDLTGFKAATKLVDYLSDLSPSSSESEDEESPVSPSTKGDVHFRRKLTVKLNIPILEQTLLYIDELWSSLAELFVIPPLSAILDKIVYGSLYITWLVPNFLVPQLMEKANQSEATILFQEKKVEMIYLDGNCIFKEESMQPKASVLRWKEWKGNLITAGDRDVIIIASIGEATARNAGVVPRSPHEPTEEDKRRMVDQGLSSEECTDDIGILQARIKLDKELEILEILASDGTRELSKKHILERLESLFKESEKAGIIVYYFGHGKRDTGDWCFQDGFITFQDITELYSCHLHGRVLTIIADCSHSGAWVNACLNYLDRQGVKPCGHSAKEKGVLINAIMSCEPAENAAACRFIVRAAVNDTSGELWYKLPKELSETQHPLGVCSTKIRCNKSIEKACTLRSMFTWKIWHEGQRLHFVRGTGNFREAWWYVLLYDNTALIREFEHLTQGEDKGKYPICISDYARVLKCGYGDAPSTTNMNDELLKVYYEVSQ